MLDIGQAPWRVIAMPVVLIALGAMLLAVVRPSSQERPRASNLVGIAWILFALAAALSVVRSDDLWYSVLIGITAVAAPAGTYLGLTRADVSVKLLGAGFLAATVVMSVRADVRFLELHGLPSESSLFAAKFQDRPYGFHYYLLGNPNGAAAFLLMPLGLAAFWMTNPRETWVVRALLGTATGVFVLTLGLLYTRSAAALGVGIVAVAVAVGPSRRAVRMAFAAGCLVALALAAALGPDYLTGSLGESADGSLSERLETTADGLRMFGEHPLTGFGLGLFNSVGGYVPAHSAVVQAAAEMGILGLIAWVVLFGSSAVAARVAVQASGWSGIRTAAALGALSFLAYCAISGGASEALYSGYSSVWGMSLALLLVLGTRTEESPRRKLT